jgi:hypothetical protein
MIVSTSLKAFDVVTRFLVDVSRRFCQAFCYFVSQGLFRGDLCRAHVSIGTRATTLTALNQHVARILRALAFLGPIGAFFVIVLAGNASSRVAVITAVVGCGRDAFSYGPYRRCNTTLSIGHRNDSKQTHARKKRPRKRHAPKRSGSTLSSRQIGLNQ